MFGWSSALGPPPPPPYSKHCSVSESARKGGSSPGDARDHSYRLFKMRFPNLPRGFPLWFVFFLLEPPREHFARIKPGLINLA